MYLKKRSTGGQVEASTSDAKELYTSSKWFPDVRRSKYRSLRACHVCIQHGPRLRPPLSSLFLQVLQSEWRKAAWKDPDEKQKCLVEGGPYLVLFGCLEVFAKNTYLFQSNMHNNSHTTNMNILCKPCTQPGSTFIGNISGCRAFGLQTCL